MRALSLVLVAGLALSAAACKSAGGPSGPPDYHEARPGTLMIWADEDRAKSLEPFAQAFAAEHGITVAFDSSGDAAGRRLDFELEVRQGRGPDLYLGDHADLGELLAEQSLAPIGLTDAQRAGYEPLTIRAGTGPDGRLYLVPHAITSVLLYRNTELVPEPPATAEDLAAAGKALVKAGKTVEALGLPVGPDGDLEAAYPFYDSAGGYLFGTNPDGSYNANDLGLEKPSAVTAFQRLATLGPAGTGAVNPGNGLGKVGGKVATGGVALAILQPAAMELARMHEGTWLASPIPGFAGAGPARPLVHVQGFYLSAAAKNRDLAERFLAERVGTVDVQTALSAAWSTAPALTAAQTHLNLDTETLLRVARDGVLLPSVPRMRKVWRPFGQAVSIVIGGGDVPAAVRTCANLIGKP